MIKKNKKNIILIIIILALIGYILYDKGVFSNINFNKSSNEQIFVPEEESDKNPTDSNTKVETKTETVVQKPVNSSSCETNVLKEITDKDTKYTKGSVLVSFLTDVTFLEARKIIKDLGYSIPTESAVETRFESGQRWFVAKVGTGNEFEAICTLRDNSDVKYVWIEPLLEFGNE